MKKIISILFYSALCVSASAYANSDCAGVLPQVTLQLTAEQWVTTQTANVSVTLDALLNKGQLANAQQSFQLALKKIAPEGDWHITEFTRNPSKTNLEQLHAVAQARLADNVLAGLRDRAKAQNGEGETYTVQDIQYAPTVDEIAAAHARLRAQIYAQAKAELDRLNAVYPKPGYSLYTINFVNVVNQPSAMMMKVNMVANETPQAAPMSLSQRLTQDAFVVLAAPPGALCAAK